MKTLRDFGSMKLSDDEEKKFTELPHCELSDGDGDGDGEGNKWQEIIRLGNWSNSYKQFEIEESHLQDFVKNFKKNVIGTSDGTVQFNYSHNPWGEASGWIEELKVEKGVLLGKVKWTDEAKKKIRDGAWKFVSAEISWEYKDQESGKVTKNVLTGAALTNIPFVKKMKSVEASEDHGTSTAQTPTEQEKNTTLLQSNSMGPEELLAEERKKNTDLSSQLSDSGTKLSEMETKLSDAEKAKTEAETKLSDMEKKVRTDKETARVESLSAEGKILPADKEKTLEMLMELPEKTADKVFETLSKAKPQVDLGELGSDTSAPNDEQKLSDADKKAAELSEKSGKPLHECLAQTYSDLSEEK